MKQIIFFLLTIYLSTTSVVHAGICCAHWGADGTCHHEYICSDSKTDATSSTEPTYSYQNEAPHTTDSQNDDGPIYSRDEDGTLKRTCCVHWGADGTCYHETGCF